MKGLLQSLEAIIAILAIVTVFVTVYSGKSPIPEFDTINWKVRGFDALKALDNNNMLRDVVVTNSTSALKDRLSGLLPSQLNYDVVICERNCGQPDIQSDKLTSVTYVIAGDLNNYLPRQIILYMW